MTSYRFLFNPLILAPVISTGCGVALLLGYFK